MNKALFLDRDGVLNKSVVVDGKPYPPKDLNSLELTDGIQDVLKRFKDHGFLLIVVTNQPDVSKGKTTKEKVEEINQYLANELNLDDVYTCFHDDQHNCNCRKPKPGMLHQANEKYNIDFNNSILVGDRWKDIKAGNEVGCRTIFIDYGYHESGECNPDYIIESPASILKIIEEIF